MRDFRDAKAMARSLRAALAAKGLKITISESLELIAQAFGVAYWNTLSAAIRAEGPTRPESARPGGTPRFSYRCLNFRPLRYRPSLATLKRRL